MVGEESGYESATLREASIIYQILTLANKFHCFSPARMLEINSLGRLKVSASRIASQGMPRDRFYSSHARAGRKPGFILSSPDKGRRFEEFV